MTTRSKTLHQNTVPDPAPWFIKELRPYGIGGLTLAALCWLGFSVIGWLQARIEAKDILLEQQTSAMVTAYNNQSASTLELSKANWNLNDSIDKLRKDLNK